MTQTTDSNINFFQRSELVAVHDVPGHVGGLDRSAADVLAGHVSGLQYRGRDHAVAGHAGCENSRLMFPYFRRCCCC